MADAKKDGAPDFVPRSVDTDVAGEPVEQVAVTGRPADKPPANSTFASRGGRGSSKSKAVADDNAENKSVRSASKK